LRGAATLLFLFALYSGSLCYPRMLFSWARDGAFIHVRSDQPIPTSAARVVALAESQIRRSPLFDATRGYPVYVCNSRWRWDYFSGFNRRSRAFETPIGRAVFIRQADWGDNQLAGPDGRDGPRPLDVYIAHEVTHMMVEDHLGLLAQRRLPVWLREGYAEYVARHDSFDYAAAREHFVARKPVPSRDPYWKYLLLVTHLLDHEKMDLNALLNAPPNPADVEARLRANLP
jgi:hypothetical protein